jgi:hypothetical protein
MRDAVNIATKLAGFALVGLLVPSVDAQKRRSDRRIPPDVSLAGIESAPSHGGGLPRGRTASTAGGDVIVQSGEIMELGAVEVILEQFDDQMGTRRLNFVQIELFSSVFGGFTTSGIGGRVHVRAAYDQDYFLGNSFLAGTHNVFMDTLSNDFMAAFSFFLSDTDEDFISLPHKLAPWIGTGQITLMSIGTLSWDIRQPEGLQDFGAGLTGIYTVTYHFTLVDCRADLNNDGIVNVRDVLAVVAAFGNLGGPEDINQDGIVNMLDLLEVVAGFGSCP